MSISVPIFFFTNNAIFNQFSGTPDSPGDYFWGVKWSQQTGHDVSCSVAQICSSVQPSWAAWSYLWPNMAFLGQNWPFLGAFGTPRGTL